MRTVALAISLLLAACGGRVVPAMDGRAHPPHSVPGLVDDRAQARVDYQRSVRAWGGWLTTALVVVGVVALVLSLVGPGARLGLHPAEAVAVLGLSGAVPVVQYVLAAWGVVAAQTALVVAALGLLASMGVIAWGLWRRVRRGRR